MNLENKNKWIAALRSGEFQQARGTLSRGRLADDPEDRAELDDATGFCCLGVACEVMVREGILAKNDIKHGDGSVTFEYGLPSGEEDDESPLDPYTVSEAMLPPVASTWLGYTGSDIYFDLTGTEYDTPEFREALNAYARDMLIRTGRLRIRASVLNDSHGFTFEQIADLLERDLDTEA